MAIIGASAAALGAEEVARDITGWTAGQQVKDVRQLADGRVAGVLAGKDPQMMSAPNLGIDLADTKTVKVTYRNQSIGAKAKLYFITEDDVQWNEAKSTRFDVMTNDAAAADPLFRLTRRLHADVIRLDGCDGLLERIVFTPLQRHSGMLLYGVTIQQ